MLGYDVAARLPELRAQAESLMVDACIITRPGAPGVFNETTGTTPTNPPVTVYTGKCQLQLANVQAGNPVVGGTEYTIQSAVLKLPVVGSESVATDDTATMTACLMDAAVVSQVFKVSVPFAKSFATARRLPCERVVA